MSVEQPELRPGEVKERWCIALEGVPSHDGRALVELENTWRDPAPVVQDGCVVGKLVDFERVKVEVGGEIHATYEGPKLPEGHVLSCDMFPVDTIPQGEELLWLKGRIAAAAIIKGQTMFGDRIKRIV